MQRRSAQIAQRQILIRYWASIRFESLSNGWAYMSYCSTDLAGSTACDH